MFAIACALLFATAAGAALLAIAATLGTYMPDVIALHALRHQAERVRFVVWQIRSTGAGLGGDDLGTSGLGIALLGSESRQRQLRASRPVQAHLRPAPTCLAA